MKNVGASKKGREEDPLSVLYQMDEDRDIHEGEALMVIMKMLNDVEKIDMLRNGLREIVDSDEVLGMRFLNLLDNIIVGIKREQMARANREWRHRFSRMFECTRLDMYSRVLLTHAKCALRKRIWIAGAQIFSPTHARAEVRLLY